MEGLDFIDELMKWVPIIILGLIVYLWKTSEKRKDELFKKHAELIEKLMEYSHEQGERISIVETKMKMK